MDFAYARLDIVGLPAAEWGARPMGRDVGWLISNPLDIPVPEEGAVVLIRYDPQDQFCRVVTPMDVEEMASSLGRYRQACPNQQAWPAQQPSTTRAAKIGW